jgi:lysophospholipase L1-like esterase
MRLTTLHFNGEDIVSKNRVGLEKLKLFIIGDSTASYYDQSRYPRMGWGQVIQKYLDKDSVEVVNGALSGRSSKSFYEEGVWNNIRENIEKGDYVLIQFGHNDEKENDPSRYSNPLTTFRDYLKIYIYDARRSGAIPVLLTSIHRNRWNKGKIEDSHREYLTSVKDLAKEMNVQLIDIAYKSQKLFESLGEDKMKDVFLILEKGIYKNYPDGIVDNTHFQENGANEIAKLVIKEISECNLEIARFVIK